MRIQNWRRYRPGLQKKSTGKHDFDTKLQTFLAVLWIRIRIRFRQSGSGSGSRSQISQKLFIFEQNFNKCKDENAKFLLNVQGFEYLRRFLIDKGNPQKISFQKKAKKFRNFEFLSRFGQSAFGFRVGSRSGPGRKNNVSETLF